MLKKIFLIAILFKCLISFSQSPIYYKIGEKEFANNDIYTVLYDESTELIYVGTNSGLFVYKENKFIQLKNSKGEKGVSFFGLKQDNNGDVYCHNLSGKIFKINKQENTFDLFYEIEGREKKGGGVAFFFTSDNNLFAANSFSIHIITPEGKEVTHLTNLHELDALHLNSFQQINDVIYFETKKNRLYQFKEKNFKEINSLFNEENARSSYFIKRDTNVFCIDINGRLKYTQSVVSKYKRLEKERYVRVNDSSFIALNSQKGYRYFYFKNDSLLASQMILPHLFISDIYQTNDNKLLIGTFGDGLLIVSYPRILKYEHDYLFLDIETSAENATALCTRSGEVFQLEKNELVLIDKSARNIDDIFYTGKNTLTNSLGFKDFFFTNSNKIRSIIRDCKVIDENVLFYSSYLSVHILIDQKKAEESKLYFTPGRFSEKVIASDERYEAVEWNGKDSLFYYSSSFGVYSREWSSGQETPILFKNNPFTASDLLYVNDQLICATSTNGILIVTDHQVSFQINENKGLHSNFVKEVIGRNDLLYILTDKGLQIYDLNKNIFLQFKNESIFEEVTDMAMSKDKLWLLEKHSYFSISLTDLVKNTQQPNKLRLYINDIFVNNYSVLGSKKSSFNYSQNHFEFIYDYRNVFNKKKTEVLYMLEGLDSDWKTTSPKDNSIVFQALSPGAYVFKIKAKNGTAFSNTFSYKFEISLPFWQTWWYYAILFFLITGSLFLFFHSRIKRLKKETIIKLEKQKLLTNSIDSELKAIRSQMNPHFIFNAINSIQDLVLQKDTLKSYDSLVQFSKLVRNTLDYSEKENILLSQEIEYLTTYLDLEKLRFTTQFEYKINNTIEQELLIPSMVIQPFVENAIKHGLLHKTGSKQLSIDFFTHENQLICRILDNGVGRERSRLINLRRQEHESFSTKAIKKRLNVLAQKTKEHYSYKTIDLKNHYGEALGTEVSVFLPILIPKNTVPKKNPAVG